MASRARRRRDPAHRIVFARVDDALERRDADIGGRVPGHNLDACALKLLQRATASGIVDRPKVDPGRLLTFRIQESPQRGGIALDELAYRVTHRLRKVIS